MIAVGVSADIAKRIAVHVEETIAHLADGNVLLELDHELRELIKLAVLAREEVIDEALGLPWADARKVPEYLLEFS